MSLNSIISVGLVMVIVLTSALPIDDPKPDDGKEIKVYLRSKRFHDEKTYGEGKTTGYVYQTHGPSSYVEIKTSYAPVKKLADAKELSSQPQPHIVLKRYKEEEEDDDDDDDEKANIEEDEDYPHELQEEGEEEEEASKESKGSKQSSGHLHADSFANGAKGQHSKDSASSSKSAKGGSSSSAHAATGHHSDHHSAGKSHAGGSHSEEKSHKKGSSTTGYHKVYHKDEYKKVHRFYDESDAKGHFEKYGGGEKHAERTAGGFRKGGSSAQGHEGEEHARKELTDSGSYDEGHRGFRKDAGSEEAYANQADYAHRDSAKGHRYLNRGEDN